MVGVRARAVWESAHAHLGHAGARRTASEQEPLDAPDGDLSEVHLLVLGNLLARIDYVNGHIAQLLRALLAGSARQQGLLQALQTVFVLIERGNYYRDFGLNCEAMSVERNAPRRMKMLRKFGVHPGLRCRDNPVTVGPFGFRDLYASGAGISHGNRLLRYDSRRI